nr:hypothetical protein [Bacteroidota bacterium]
STRLTFSYEITNKKINKIEMHIDDIAVRISHNYWEHYVVLDKDLECFHGPGIYNLRLDIFTNSGTGSIADLAGSEGYLYRKECILVMVDWLAMPQINAIQYKDGLIEIIWDEYKGEDFQSYTLKKYNYIADGKPTTFFTPITNKAQYSINDNTYVGEAVFFQLDTKIDGHSNLSDPFEMPKDIPQIHLEKINSGASFKYTWNKTKYHKNFAGYKLSLFQDPINFPPKYYEITTLQGINDTVYIYEGVKIGEKVDFLLTIVPQYTHTLYNSYFAQVEFFSTNNQGFIGESFPVYYQIKTPVGPLQYFKDVTEFKIKTYDPVNNSLDSITTPAFNYYNFDVSANSKYMLAHTSVISVVLFDMQNHTYEIIECSDIIGHNQQFNTMGISDNGIGAIYEGGKIYVYDFINKNILATRDFGTPPEITVSSDGQYLATELYGKHRVWKVENNTLTLMLQNEQWNTTFMYLNFNPLNDEELLVYSDHTLHYVNRPDMIIEQSIPMTLQYVTNMDFNEGMILGITEDDLLTVCDINSGEVLWQWPKVEYAGGFYLFHRQITCQDGYRFGID